MQETVLSQLKDKTGKLTKVVERMKKDIENSKSKLTGLKRDVAQNDIELSLIHDAYLHKYGEKTHQEFEELFETIREEKEAENIRLRIEKANMELKELKAESNRLSGLVPQTEIIQIDQNVHFDILDREKELKSLRIQNQKIEKNINLIKNKISLANSEKNDMKQALDAKKIKDKQLSEQRKEAERLTKAITLLSVQFKDESSGLKSVQERLASVNIESDEIDAQLVKETPIAQDDLKEAQKMQTIRDEIEGYNKQLRNYRTDYDDFMELAPRLSDVIKNQISNINSFIDVIRAELEVVPQEV